MMRRSRAPVVVKRTARPSLVGTMARTAVVAGTATAVAGAVGGAGAAQAQAKQAQQAQQAATQQQMADLQANQAALAAQQAALAAQQAAAPPAAPAGMGMDDKLAQLQKLGELRTMGILTDAEFEEQKAKILAI